MWRYAAVKLKLKKRLRHDLRLMNQAKLYIPSSVQTQINFCAITVFGQIGLSG